MSKYVFLNWINSSGGPLVVMEEAKASLWNGMGGSPSDFDLACQSVDYANKLTLHGSDVLVLGDEPLQTAIATSDSRQLIVRWKWADNEADVRAAIEHIDFNTINIIEKLKINWVNQPLVVFDAVDIFDPAQCLRFSTHSGSNEVSTFIHQPTSRTSLLVHAIAAV
ncbi:Imm21 family immunity protein [Burkholderia vietnamiensis]|uniref:Imm21 family immunity protein n=1 Tax=Burkholderia vietnamiensis TaxID=60552 RepID=UPI000759FEBB|nr:Imm21 family immunity protein [Burkholderia vietnamiensis]KVF64941.1 hypothetical protein WJ17_22620 [Burkholderia vietnamiensis]